MSEAARREDGTIDSSPPSGLYARLGGPAAVRDLVDRFYAAVTIDPLLDEYFSGVDLARLKRHQAAFLSAALGGPREYIGADMAEVHAGLGVSGPAFDRFFYHLLYALAGGRVAEQDLDAVAAAVRPLRAAIVTDSPEDTARQ